MIDDAFSARLAASQAGLSPKMAQLAAYVSEHYVQVAFMSTRDLAAAAGVSLATVVRFPAALGYPNFDAMRASIQDRINFDLTGVERLGALSQENSAPSALLRRILDGDFESLQTLVHTFSEPQFERFVAALLNAERVTILGFRYASPLAVYFEYSLAKIRHNVAAFTQADSSLYDRVRLMDAGDVLIVLTFARYPADLVALTRYAHDLGVRVLAITDSALSPVLPFAKVVLFAKATMLGFVGSLAAPGALINCVLWELSARLGDVALERLDRIEEAASEAHIFAAAAPFRGRRPDPKRGESRAPSTRRDAST